MKSYVALFICLMSLTARRAATAIAAEGTQRRRRRQRRQRRQRAGSGTGRPANKHPFGCVGHRPDGAGRRAAEVAHGHVGGPRNGSHARSISRPFHRRRCKARHCGRSYSREPHDTKRASIAKSFSSWTAGRRQNRITRSAGATRFRCCSKTASRCWRWKRWTR